MVHRARKIMSKMSLFAGNAGQKRWHRLERQCWSASHSSLDRSIIGKLADNQNPEANYLLQAIQDSKSLFMFYHNGKILVDTSNNGLNTSIAWRPHQAVQQLNLRFHELENDSSPEYSTFVLLGKNRSSKTVNEKKDYPITVENENENKLNYEFHFAVDASVINENDLCAQLQKGKNDIVTELISPRSLLGKMNLADVTVVGQAVSRMNWHNEVRFCRRTGRPIYPSGAGHRKIDPLETNRRLNTTYPRTDPVAIMLVTSADGSKCLLGRTKRRHKSNMYSCLAGFIEQSESVEDAVRRETFEESGIVVGDDVQIVGSQPWPIGAAGHTELMLGCIARAETDVINFDEDEMSDVRWFNRDEVREMLQRSFDANPLGDASENPLVVPPPYAIAHHLIKSWAENNHMSSNNPATKILSLVASAVAGALLAVLVQSRL
mmetsp:Transcript_28248/g.34395  ORF Transcript_28248/g.34395 Transcript_28248/m.34395 type:complete len:435 (-) Transcript_28248:2536-3840(-)